MFDWLTDAAGPGYASAILWTLAALVLLVVVLVGIRIFRSMRGGTFVAGGRHRKHRLAVSDATAVDAHRRLVLVRRDDVEHLILIGGPTDVVVEQNIRAGQPETVRPAEPAPVLPTPEPRPRQPEPPTMMAARQTQEPEKARAAQPVPPRAAPAARPAEPAPRPVSPARPPAPPVRTDQPVRREPQMTPRREAAAPLVAAPPPQPARSEPVMEAPRKSEAVASDLDAALLDELQVTLEDNPGRGAHGNPDQIALEDEMNRLLDDLSDPRRA